jgi:hypothetical protein
MAIDKHGTAKKRSGVARYSPEGMSLLFDGAPDRDVPPTYPRRTSREG